MTTCEECGAAVVEVAKHEAWHDEWQRKVDDVEATASEAYDRAEQANNTLYQNNISV